MKVGRDLLNEDFVKKNPAWVKVPRARTRAGAGVHERARAVPQELELMLHTKVKAEIRAFAVLGGGGRSCTRGGRASASR